MKSTLKLSLMLAALSLFSCAEAPVRSNLSTRPLPPSAFDAELSNYNYPRDVSFFEFQSQGQPLRMAYELAEPARPNGRTVLLLHGKNFTAAYWENTIQALLDRGFRVVAPDQIGFGKSSKPAAYQFTFQALSANTQALLASLKIEKVSIVGHSMGGMLATRFALQYPTAVEKLVLVNPIGLEDWQRSVPYRTVEETYQAELKATPASIREYQRVNYFGGEWKESYAPLVEVASGFTRHPDYPRVAWNSALTADMIFTQPVLYDFPRLALPTLLIIGQRDRTAIGRAYADPAAAKLLGNYPKLGRAAARAIKKSQLVELPGLGHLPQVEDFPKFRAALLKFL